MNNQVRLVACDVDGTLLFNYAPALPASTLQVIGELLDQGIAFVPASGRAYDSLCKLFGPYAQRMVIIANNGTIAYRNDQPVFRSAMDRSLGASLIGALEATGDLEVLVTGARTSYMHPKDPRFISFMSDTVGFDITVVDDLQAIDEPFTKISAYFPSRVIDDRPWVEAFGERCSIAVAGFGWLDFMPKGTSKARALAAVLDLLQVAPENVVALGDEQNDLEMLQMAGLSIAMETGDPRVIEAADRTTSSAEAELRKLLTL